MKKLFLLFTSVTFTFFISCGDEILESPEIEQDNWIDLPVNLALGDTTEFDVSSEVVGSDGGCIEFTKQFSGGPHGQYCISAKLLIKPGTFADNDTIDFTLSIDAANASVLISPVEDYFNKPLKLTLTYCGIDLTGVDPCELDFGYSNGTDIFIDVPYDDVVVDTLTGMLEVEKALIQHIPDPVPNGRYGWIRKLD